MNTKEETYKKMSIAWKKIEEGLDGANMSELRTGNKER